MFIQTMDRALTANLAGLSKVRTGWPYLGDFGNFFNGFAKGGVCIYPIMLCV